MKNNKKVQLLTAVCCFIALTAIVYLVNLRDEVQEQRNEAQTPPPVKTLENTQGNLVPWFDTPVPQTPPDKGYTPGEILVQFQPNTPFDIVDAILNDADAEIAKEFGTPGLYLVTLPDSMTVEQGERYFAGQREVRFSEPNLIYHILLEPNDPEFPRLWGMHNTGQTGGVADADIDAPEAWNRSTGDSDVVIGIIDTGVDYTHPDIAPNVWTNPLEIPDNDIDDDGNGWVDDIHGIASVYHHGDPMDDVGHGTHVFGTIAASGNDNFGVAGVMWEADVISCKFLSSFGWGELVGALACIDYFIDLVDRGVEVVAINNSWGGADYSEALEDSIERLNDRGVLFVAAAGNSSQNNDLNPKYPASYNTENVIAVAAIDEYGELAGFSNFGINTVDIAAPGVNVLSTVLYEEWRKYSGTSMASPHVTGSLGLIASVNPLKTGAELKQHLLDSAEYSVSLEGLIANGRKAVIEFPFEDLDGDGMDDDWERLYGFDPSDVLDGDEDFDNDGLTNLEEFLNYTLPDNNDSDGEGLTDGQEVNTFFTDPRKPDTDNDGLTDLEEISVYSTNPLNPDSDSDGATDFFEVTASGTDPLNSDSDADGLSDGWEIGYGLDPNSNTDAGIDSDGDGLSNLEEFQLGLAPTLTDTDEDGLSDFDELNTYDTSPTEFDTDSDRMGDGWEIAHGLDPLTSGDAYLDFDEDSYSNLVEFLTESDPTNSSITPPEEKNVLNLLTDSEFFSRRWSRTIPTYDYYQTIVNGGGKIVSITRDKFGLVQLVAYSIIDGQLLWSVPFDFYGSIHRSHINEDFVYIFYDQDGEAHFVGLDAQTGEEVFDVLVSSFSVSYYNTSHGGDFYFFETDFITRVDGTNGEVIWQVSKDYLVSGVFDVSDDYVVHANNEKIYVYDAETGLQVGDIFVHGTAKGCIESGSTRSVVVDKDFVYFSNAYCISKANIVAQTVDYTIGFYDTVQLEHVTNKLIAKTNTEVAVFDDETGNFIKNFAVDFFYDRMLVSLNHIFLSMDLFEELTVAYDFDSGEIVWSSSIGGELGFDSKGGLIIQNKEGRTQVVNLEGDFDADGMPTWWERYYGLKAVNGSDALEDADGDGLSNLEEFEHLIDPISADTDQDGLDDFSEVEIYLTSARKADTDEDGLTDPDELDQWSTDPLQRDTDGDLFSDAEEVLIYESSPTNFSSIPSRIGNLITSFEQGQSNPWSETTDSETSWAVASDYSHDGEFSFKALNGPEEEIAAIEWSGFFKPGFIEFQFSFEEGRCCDYVNFYVNGEQVERLRANDEQWRKISTYLKGGAYTLRIEFQRSIGSIPFDASFWVDSIEFVERPFATKPKNILTASSGLLYEHDPQGNLVAGPVDLSIEFDNNKDLVVTANHEIAVANAPYLHIYNTYTGSMRTILAEDWSQESDSAGSGSIISLGNHLYASNSNGGLVRFSQEGTFVDYILTDVAVDNVRAHSDGTLYTMKEGGYGSVLREFSSSSLAEENSIIFDDYRSYSFEIDSNKNIYIANLDTVIIKLNQLGEEIDRKFFNRFTIEDLTLIDDDYLYTSGREGIVRGLDLNLNELFAENIHEPDQKVDYIAPITFYGNDEDSDGLPDWWEIHHGLDKNDFADSNADSDGDNLSNLLEYLHYSNPLKMDTDEDGLLDGEEVSLHSSEPSVSDSDGDGISDSDEVNLWGTLPNIWDSDGDGLSDSAELFNFESDPANSDSDGDQILDGWEYWNRLSLLNPSDAGLDFDFDGLSNQQEFLLGTNIYDIDTDGDGLNDGREVIEFSTDPLDSDTDSDVMTDGWEVRFEFDPLVANNSDVDTDGDFVSDLSEFYANSNPINNSVQPELGNWAMFQANAKHTGYVPVMLKLDNPQAIWSIELPPFADLPQRQGQVSIDGEQVFTVNSTGTFAIDLYTGAINWQEPAPDYYVGFGQPAFDDEILYIQVIDRDFDLIRGVHKDGSGEVFSTEFAAQWPVIVSPTLTDNQIYFMGGYHGGVYNYDKAGELVWFQELQQFHDWTPAVSGDYIVANAGDSLSILNRHNGSIVNEWIDREFEFSEYQKRYSPVLGNNNNAFIVQNRRLTNVDIFSSEIHWKKSDRYFGQLGYAEGVVYALNGNVLEAIDELTGNTIWEFYASGFLQYNVVVTKGHVFASTADTVWAVDRATGEQVWFESVGGQLSVSNNGVLLAANPEGFLHAYRFLENDDSDGIPTDWELQQGLDTSINNRNSDLDQDGLFDWEEYEMGVSPNDPDSDGDGLLDGDEKKSLVKTKPNLFDSDGDRLSDGDEVNLYNTDPNLKDTDGDGLDDFIEVVNLSTRPDSRDSDSDGFSDKYELRRGLNPLSAASAPSPIREFMQDFESTSFPEGWYFPEDELFGWELSYDSVIEGRFSLKSTLVPNNSTAVVEWADNFEFVEIEFEVYFLTQDSRDELRFYVDGEVVRTVSGTGGRRINYSLSAGSHTLRWEFFNKEYDIENDSAVVIDNIAITSGDSDGDSLPDYWEERYGLPIDRVNDREDPDGDGYSNSEEFVEGTDPTDASSSPASNPPPPSGSPPASGNSGGSSSGGGGGGSVDLLFMLLVLFTYLLKEASNFYKLNRKLTSSRRIMKV